jgi:hypothetical protein
LHHATNEWVRQITELQREDGSWGHFHTLSKPTTQRPITTEQALRRLRALGLKRGDAPIDRALAYMRGVLLKENTPPDHREHVLNWDAFEAHMFAAWIRIFAPDDPLAMPVARQWAEIVTPSFQTGVLDETVYAAAYRKRIPVLHAGERIISLSQFYIVNLLQGVLDPVTERKFVEHILSYPTGIYYVYGYQISILPENFASRQTSAYLAALEQLAGYACAGDMLQFAADWLLRHRDKNGEWDLGAAASDGIYFPLSASWRRPEDRRKDCTARVERLLQTIG